MSSNKSSRKTLLFLTCLTLFALEILLVGETAYSKVKRVIKLPEKSSQSKRTTKKRKKRKFTKEFNQATGQEFIFMGCDGEEENFKEITKTLIRAQEAWDNHDSKALAKEYTADFRSHYGTPMSELIKDLDQFWAKYQNTVTLDSFSNVIFVCDNRAYVNLSEVMRAKVVDPKNNKAKKEKKEEQISPEAITWINGITRLERTADGWKISAEEILSEESWFYYGNLPEELLKRRLINFDVPVSVNAGENYIVNLKYVLPQNIAVNLLIEKKEISDSPNSKVKSNKDSETEDQLERLKAKQKEINELKRTVLGTNLKGIKRILKANSRPTDEKISAQMTFLSLKEDNRQIESFLGYLEITKKLIVKSLDQSSDGKEKINSEIKKKTFREEVLGL